MDNKKRKITIVLCVLFFALMASTALAIETAWPQSPMSKIKIRPDTNLAEMMKYFYEWAIALGGIATFISFVAAGFQYIISVGNPAVTKDAVDRMKSAMFGLVLLLSAYVILNTINPQLVKFKLNPFSMKDYNPMQACDTASECSKSSEDAGLWDCVGGDPSTKGKEGVCVYKGPDAITCSEVFAYEELNFQGDEKKLSLDPDGDPEKGTYKSFRAYFKYIDPETKKAVDLPCDKPIYEDGDGNKIEVKEPDQSGCGCIVQLFGGAGWEFWKTCGDKIGDIPAYEGNVGRWVDREVTCVRAVQPTESESY